MSVEQLDHDLRVKELKRKIVDLGTIIELMENNYQYYIGGSKRPKACIDKYREYSKLMRKVVER